MKNFGDEFTTISLTRTTAIKTIFVCISYNSCFDEAGRCNPGTNTKEAQAEDEEGIDVENAKENER